MTPLALLGPVMGLLKSKFAGTIMLVVAVLLACALLGQCGENRQLVRQAEAAEQRATNAKADITRPKTGWAARLTQCQGNVSGLRDAVGKQTASLDALKAEGERRTAAASRALAAIRSDQARAESAAAQLAAMALATENGSCPSLQAIDAAVLKTLR